MTPRTLTLCFFLAHLVGFTEANHAQPARMTFTDKETEVRRSRVPGQQAEPVQILLQTQRDHVTAVGRTHLYSLDFKSPQKAPVERRVVWKGCTPQRNCDYNIVMVHETEEARQALVCGANGRETLCCNMDLSAESPACIPSEKMDSIVGSIRGFPLGPGDPSALVESAESADLYVAFSGTHQSFGLRKFGKNSVGSERLDKEQRYVGLMSSRRRDDPRQDKVYAFYREKNKASDVNSDLWMPFVTRVCMSDTGGPKNNLQFTWTSQLSARLYCGDPDERRHFSELVDVAFVHATDWRHTRVYGLFRNAWGMSAVCVYTVEDMDNVFATSPFKVSDPAKPMERARTCAEDSTKIPSKTLEMIRKTSEMERRVQTGPLLSNHHNYSHIHADATGSGDAQHVVLFLSANNGRIHKMIHTQNGTFFIAEYRPFDHRAHILSINFHRSSRKLYVSSGRELVQLDMENCGKYGDSCEQCVLARDPYCGWNGTHCAPETRDQLQNVTTGDYSICPVMNEDFSKLYAASPAKDSEESEDSVALLPPRNRYFLRCPVSSHYAAYSWRHRGIATACEGSADGDECLRLIDSMGPEQEGLHECVSVEQGFARVLARRTLRLENRAGAAAGPPLSNPLLWACLAALLMKP